MFTLGQLLTYYTNLTGRAPDAVVRLTLDAYAYLTQLGELSGAEVLARIDAQWGPPAPPVVTTPTDPVTDDTDTGATAPNAGSSAPTSPAKPVPVINPTQTLKTFYAAVTGTDFAAIGEADGRSLSALATQVGSGTMTLAAAETAVAKMAAGTTSVVNLTYQFFTGATPYASGVAYLVGGLAGAGYQAMSLEDRYINFAVNLGKLGEGQARFAAAYGGLSLAQALTKAYAEIFGTAPTDAKVHELLDAQLVVNGQTLTRAQYFALFGQDGETGIGTKAAMVGWLLAEAVKADVGPYAAAQDAFLADLGPDGVAQFHVDLLGAYGAHVAAPAGATIAIAHDQSASPTASSLALRTTDNSDVITGADGLDAGQAIATGAGDDRVTIKGVVNGKILLGDGDSIVTLDGLGATGTVTFGGGANVVNLGGVLAAGASLSASGTNNVLHLTSATASVLGTVTGFQTVVLDAPVGADALAGVKGAQVIYDKVASTFGEGVTVAITAANHETVVLKNTAYGVVITDPTAAGAKDIVVHLDGFAGAPSISVGDRNSYSADGGSITILSGAGLGAGTGKVTLHVDSDSTAGMIYAYAPAGAAARGSPIAIPTLELQGRGKLTAQIFETFTRIDASRGGDFDLTYAVAGGVGIDKLKAAPVGAFVFSDWTDKLSVTLGHASDKDYAGPMKFVLGAGADTIVATAGAQGLNNLAIVDNAVFVTAEVTGFKTGVDHLVLDAVSHGAIVSVQAQADGAASLTQALTQVSAKVAANGLAVFTYGGDTYVYVQDDLAGLNMGGAGHAGDGLIKLTGVMGLSVATGAASGDIHWA